MAQKKNKKKSSVRIISGIWRSRRIEFLDQPHIRPTPDRVRETLFNWLGDSVVGARCLDIFSGSGALGFEAASRGAEQVVLVDADLPTCNNLNEQKKALSAAQVDVMHRDALSYLHNTSDVFGLVFIDPPFATDLYSDVISSLLTRQLLTTDNLLYIESSSKLKTTQKEMLDKLNLTCIREKTAGDVHFGLYRATTV